jgi:hypothetical protein
LAGGAVRLAAAAFAVASRGEWKTALTMLGSFMGWGWGWR